MVVNKLLASTSQKLLLSRSETANIGNTEAKYWYSDIPDPSSRSYEKNNNLLPSVSSEQLPEANRQVRSALPTLHGWRLSRAVLGWVCGYGGLCQ
ncbi:hypothetical protein E2C01_016049 [Portunus trituberculatus]|uniref:Uncharacterized protein n=1 Tax=Portunus trituberculatus TaxID=210409 RepID=A0A5B7DN16_PORTR|nr:hypothetical protein [Portunus trituberculatus]